MRISRKTNREDQERTLQYISRQENLLSEQLQEDKLTQLLAFIGRLEQTPPGVIELQSRIKSFGKCQRMAEETSGQFYGRLRHWLDRSLPQTRMPRHPPRQNDD